MTTPAKPNVSVGSTEDTSDGGLFVDTSSTNLATEAPESSSTTPAAPDSFTGSTDNAADGGLFTDANINGIADIKIVKIIAGTGLVGTSLEGPVPSLNVIGGTGITANADDISIDSTVVTLVGAQTLTNKNIDADNNTILNIEVDNFKSGVLDTDLTTVSATDNTLASAKAIKSYVDSQVTSQDLDFQADTGGVLAIDLDSEVLTFTGGTGIDTSGSGNAVTFAIDSTVTTLSGTQTLTNKTLTLPKINENVEVTSTSTELNYLDITTLGTVEASKAVTADANGDVLFPDNEKAIFGTGSDLEIYHDSNRSYISEQGTGPLRVLSSQLEIKNSGDNSLGAKFVASGAVELNYNNVKKFETTSAGATVTGDLTVTSNIESAGGEIHDFVFGSQGFSLITGLRHSSLTSSTTQYALLQSSTGKTYLNSAVGNPIDFRIGNTTYASLESSTFNIQTTEDGGPILNLISNDPGDVTDFHTEGTINFKAENSANQQHTYATITLMTDDVTDGTEDGRIRFHVARGASSGSLYEAFDITSTRIQIRNSLPLAWQNAGGSNINTELHITTPTATRTISLPDASGTVLLDTGNQTFTGNLTFPDNQELKFGTGGDLVIRHEATGSHSVIRESGAGSLFIDASDLQLRSGDFQKYAVFTLDGSAELYYDNVKKFETTSTGVEITGDLDADNIIVNNDLTISNGSDSTTNIMRAHFVASGTHEIHVDPNDQASASTLRLAVDGEAYIDMSSSSDLIFMSKPILFKNTVDGISWEGATNDAFETLLTVSDPTAARTITLPDDSGTVAIINTSGETQITSTDPGTTGAKLSLYHNSVSPAFGDSIGQIAFKGNDNASPQGQADYFLIESKIINPSSTFKAADLKFYGYSQNNFLHLFSFANSYLTMEQNQPLLWRDASNNTTQLRPPTSQTQSNVITLPDAGGTVRTTAIPIALNDLSDVVTTSFSDGNPLQWNNSQSRFERPGVNATVVYELETTNGIIDVKNAGVQSEVRLYCESANAHYAALKAPAHSTFSGNVDLTLPSTTGVLKSTGTETIWVPATSMTPRQTNGFTLERVSSSGTSYVQLEGFKIDSTNVSTTVFAEFNIAMPKSWNAGSFTARHFFLNESANNWTVSNFYIRAANWQSGSTLNYSMGTAANISNTVVNSNVRTGLNSGTFTAAGNITGDGTDLVNFQIYKNTTGLGSAVYFYLGSQIFFTTNASNDN